MFFRSNHTKSARFKFPSPQTQVRDRMFYRVYAHIAENNVASLKGFRSAGFSTTRRVIIRRILGWDHVVENAAPLAESLDH